MSLTQGLARLISGHYFLADDVDNQGEGRGHIVTPRLSDEGHPRA